MIYKGLPVGKSSLPPQLSKKIVSPVNSLSSNIMHILYIEWPGVCMNFNIIPSILSIS